MTAPAWLSSDRLAVILLARGVPLSEVDDVVERAAICQWCGGMSELEAIIAANGSCPESIRRRLEQTMTADVLETQRGER